MTFKAPIKRVGASSTGPHGTRFGRCPACLGASLPDRVAACHTAPYTPTLPGMSASKCLLLTLALATFTLPAPAEVFNAQGELAGEPGETSILVQSRLTRIPGPETDENGDIPGAPGVARFEFGTSQNFEHTLFTPWMRAEAERDYIVRFRLQGLQPGTVYFYRLVYGETEQELKTGPARQFRTLPERDSEAPLSFAMGSCQNYAFFMHGAAGDGKGAASEEDRREGYPAYAAMRALKPDFFVGTGDIVYYDHPAKTAARTLPELRRKWHEQFRLPRLVHFFSTTAAFWSKDDHDFRFNDADRAGETQPSPGTGIAVFREQMPVLAQADKVSPTYRTRRVHRHVQLWFLEGRDYRSSNKMPDGPEKTIWGREQRDWLERTLRESDATWKVIISPTPMVGPDSNRKNDNHANWGGFRHEADSFFSGLKRDGLERVLIFCGDRHWQYYSIHPQGFEEFSCGALNDENAISGVAPGSPKSTDPEGLIRQPFLYPKPTGGFLHVSVNGGSEAKLNITFRDDQGRAGYTVEKTFKPQ